MIHSIQCLPVLAALLCASVVQAQNSTTLPPTGRIVFKCVVGKKAVYSDDPCPGAQRIDIEPTRGFSRSTGRESVGADVARENHRDQMAEIWKPVTGLTPRQLAVHQRRYPLTLQDRLECDSLDAGIAQLENKERAAPLEDQPAVKQQLYLLRKRDRALRC